MFSYGEIFLTIAAAIALCGPKDVPIIARTAGRLVGRAVGYIQEVRGQVDNVIKRSQVDQVHKELQEAMAQLEAIRHEIRNGMSISSFGPLTKSVEHTELNRSFAASAFNQAEPGELHSSLAVTSSPTTPSNTIPGFSSVIESMSVQSGSNGTLKAKQPSMSRISTQRVTLNSPSNSGAARLEISRTTGDIFQDTSILQNSRLGAVGQDVTVLPVSALSAGVLPSRTGPFRGGADLLLDSIVERTVAFDAKKFLQQSDLTI